jgi:hypothetical protein
VLYSYFVVADFLLAFAFFAGHQSLPWLIDLVKKVLPKIDQCDAPLLRPESELYKKVKTLLPLVVNICRLDGMHYEDMYYIRLLQESLCFTVMETEMTALAKRIDRSDCSSEAIQRNLFAIGSVMHIFRCYDQQGCGLASLPWAMYGAKLRKLLNQRNKERLLKIGTQCHSRLRQTRTKQRQRS